MFDSFIEDDTSVGVKFNCVSALKITKTNYLVFSFSVKILDLFSSFNFLLQLR